jgi:hypothetical protein
MDVQIKRGVEAMRSTITPKVGEPIFTTDEKELYIGDGSTVGGIPVGTIKPVGAIVDDYLAMFNGTSGNEVKATSKASFLNGYATETYATNQINTLVPDIKVTNADLADDSLDSQLLNGRSDYLNTDVLTESYTEDDANKVVTASGVYQLGVDLGAADATLTSNKIDKTSITASLTSTNSSQVLAATAGKTINDKVSTNTSNISTNTSNIATNTSNISTNTSNIATHTTHLSKLPAQITKGTGNPSGGVDGDIYLQY